MKKLITRRLRRPFGKLCGSSNILKYNWIKKIRKLKIT